MTDIRGFVRAVQDKYGMRPVMPFQAPIEIGDVGHVGKDGVWRPRSTIRQRFGIAPGGIRSQSDARGVWQDQSGRNVKFHLYAKGQTSELYPNVADAKARTEIELGSARSFVFAAKGVTVQSATELDDVIKAIRTAYHNRRHLPEDRRWDKELAFIFAVGSASSFVAMLAESGNTKLAVMGRAKVGPPAAPAELTASIRFGSESNELQKVNQRPAPKCFYRAYKLNPSILLKWTREKPQEVQFSTANLLLTPDGGAGLGAPPPGGFGRASTGHVHAIRVSRASVPSFDQVFVDA
jgi:hypothetical protein